MSNVGKRYVLKLNLKQIQAVLDSLEANAKEIHDAVIDKKRDRIGAHLRNVRQTVIKQLRKQSTEWVGLAGIYPHERAGK